MDPYSLLAVSYNVGCKSLALLYRIEYDCLLLLCSSWEVYLCPLAGMEWMALLVFRSEHSPKHLSHILATSLQAAQFRIQFSSVRREVAFFCIQYSWCTRTIGIKHAYTLLIIFWRYRQFLWKLIVYKQNIFSAHFRQKWVFKIL